MTRWGRRRRIVGSVSLGRQCGVLTAKAELYSRRISAASSEANAPYQKGKSAWKARCPQRSLTDLQRSRMRQLLTIVHANHHADFA